MLQRNRTYIQVWQKVTWSWFIFHYTYHQQVKKFIKRGLFDLVDIKFKTLQEVNDFLYTEYKIAA